MLHRITTQIGQTATDHGAICTHVREYLAAVHVDPPEGSSCPDWDGALMAWVAIKDGIVPPVNSGNPMAWLAWGTPLDTPAAGAVAILTAGTGRHRMTVGIVARVQGAKVYLIGAWDNVVQMRAVQIEQVIACRRPPGASMPTQPDAAPGLSLTINNALPAYPAPLQIAAPAELPGTQQVIPPQAQQLPSVPGVPPEALARLLEIVKGEFASVHARIDHVAAHAVANVQFDPEGLIPHG
jgi:hypothetical protein